jgi:hypothetical protein
MASASLPERANAQRNRYALDRLFLASNDVTPLYSVQFPEPSTWAMMAIRFAGLGYGECRRSRKTAIRHPGRASRSAWKFRRNHRS